MGNISTFGAFTTARLGIYASQKALEVTGNNIANINTRGYSRQRLDQISLHLGGADRYSGPYDARVGQGVLCTGVSQMRDPYLDIRYRGELTNVGAMDAKLEGFQDLAGIFDEVGKGKGDGVIEKQLSDLIQQMNNLVTQGAGKDNFDSLVKSSASVLASLFNTYANKLGSLKETTIDGFKQNLTAVNNILENIRNLNSSIRSSEIHGDSALSMKDERNLLIDELSSYIKIDVTYEKEDLGAGLLVDKLVIKMGGNGQGTATERATLVDGLYATSISIQQDQVFNPDGTPALDGKGNPIFKDNENYNLILAPLVNKRGHNLAGSTQVNLGDNDLYGSLQSTREILTEKGEYSTAADIANDPKASVKRGIPYYQNTLDALANKFATVLNDANKLPDNVIYDIDAAGNKTLKPEYANYKGGNLFSNSGNGNDDTPPITAANISISQDWGNGKVHMLQSKEPNFTSTDNSNLTHILYLLTADQKYAPSDTVAGGSGTVYFTGNFQKMLTNISSVLANDGKTAATMLENYSTSATSLYANRDSVMGVDLNDEAMNLMQYQKSYSASCRLMTTLDQVLDKLINGTAI